MSFADNLFWDNVSGEHDRRMHHEALVRSKVNVAPYWPFLSAASSEADFENRLSLSLSRISSLVAPETLDEVISSLRDDFRAVTGVATTDDDEVKEESDKAKGQSKDETNRDDDPDDKDADGDDEGESDSDDDDSDKSKGNQPNWLDKKQRDKSTTDRDKKDDVKKKANAYQPDPTADQRYYAPYAGIESLPLNNGDLQGPDGFIQDLAEGEQRTPDAYARQTTPGQWTNDPSTWTERQMPQSVERGYQSTAAKNKVPLFQPGDAVQSFRGEGATIHSVIPSNDPGKSHRVTVRWDDPQKNLKWNGEPDDEGAGDKNAYYEEVFHHKHGSVHLDSAGFVVTPKTATFMDADGFLFEATVDPVPGAPLTGNPYYFDQGRAGLTGEGFPQNPGPEPLADRANDYGVVGPVSTGSAEGTVDGNGYSNSQPGNHTASQGPRNFNRAANSAIRDEKWYQLGKQHRENGEPHALNNGSLRALPGSVQHASYNSGWADGGDDDHDQFWFNRPKTAENRYNEGFYDRQNNRAPIEHSEPASEEAQTYRQGYSDAHEHYSGAAADRATQQTLFGHTGSTDGKIVGLCPGCNQPLRKHTTAHGDEYHHLHNDHVRCHGPRSKTANKYIQQSGDKWVITQKGTGKILSHHDSKEKAEEAFRAMEMNKHSGISLLDKEGFLVQSGDYIGRPDAFNPTGRGPDEYKARTWDAYENTGPRQTAEDRGINTPVLPAERIRTKDIGAGNPQFNRDTDRLEQSGDDEDED